VFAEKGVSRTSLQDIALAAGVTRGAIYWHFKNKAELFNAMMECVILPMEQAMQQIGHDASQDPLAELERAMLQSLHSIATDASTRATFEIATQKVEYVDELLVVKQRHVKSSADCTFEMQRSLQEAAVRRSITLAMPSSVAAQGLQALMVGLIHSWMLAPEAFELVAVSRSAIRTYLVGLGLQP
jgi:TetR/AcrR family acrAB operon transcriptional repressor